MNGSDVTRIRERERERTRISAGSQHALSSNRVARWNGEAQKTRISIRLEDSQISQVQ